MLQKAAQPRGCIDPCEEREDAEMPHGHPQSKKESQGVENEITALVLETRNTGLFQLVLPSGFCIVVGMISKVSVEGKTRLAMLLRSQEFSPPLVAPRVGTRPAPERLLAHPASGRASGLEATGRHCKYTFVKRQTKTP